MKKFIVALAAVLGLAFVMPIPAAQAETVKKVIIKRGHDHGHHYGWRNHHRANKVVIVKKRGDHHM
jgi:hypothetical protein